MRPVLYALITLFTLAFLSTAATDPEETSELYADNTYREARSRLTVLVDSFHVAQHADYPYIPVAVALGLMGKGSPVTFTPGSFTLVDREGTGHAAADYTELLHAYAKLPFDSELLRVRPLQVGQQFDHSQRVRANFYPPVDNGLRTPMVQLARRTWFTDVIYFPLPRHGLDGVLTLRVQGEAMEEPVEVRFRAPLEQQAGRAGR